MKHLFYTFLTGLLLALTSPSGALQIVISTGEHTTWRLVVGGETVMKDNRIAMQIDDRTIGPGARVVKQRKGRKDEHIVSPFFNSRGLMAMPYIKRRCERRYGCRGL